MESETTKFLKNIINTEGVNYYDLLGAEFEEREKKGKLKTLKELSCKALVYDALSNPIFKEGRKKIIKYFNKGIGGLIDKLRRLKFSDWEIYKRIVKSRDDFLKSEDLENSSYDLLVQQKKCLNVYCAVKTGLETKIRRELGGGIVVKLFDYRR